VEYGKYISGEAVKGLTNAVVGAVLGMLLLWAGQTWFASELEYKQFSKNDSFTRVLGPQGLTIAYEGKPLKNVSIVDFIITNQASRQFTDVDLLFSVDDSKSPMTLVSSGIITPTGLPHDETVEELPVKDTRTKKFRLKVIPKQHKTEYFDAIFVFDGEKAPSMSVVSLSKEVSIGAYQEWKAMLKAVGVGVLIGALGVTVLILLRLWDRPRAIGRFSQHAAELRKRGELKSADEQAIGDAITIYASFVTRKAGTSCTHPPYLCQQWLESRKGGGSVAWWEKA
jgi:hypothetical protein